MKRRRAAPAKINLALDILGIRPDGYHDMKMVMQTISLCDTVTVEETAAGFHLRTNGDFIPAGKKTLEQRAAEAFFGEGDARLRAAGRRQRRCSGPAAHPAGGVRSGHADS